MKNYPRRGECFECLEFVQNIYRTPFDVMMRYSRKNVDWSSRQPTTKKEVKKYPVAPKTAMHFGLQIRVVQKKKKV